MDLVKFKGVVEGSRRSVNSYIPAPFDNVISKQPSLVGCFLEKQIWRRIVEYQEPQPNIIERIPMT
jgi:hypothetical protein